MSIRFRKTENIALLRKNREDDDIGANSPHAPVTCTKQTTALKPPKRNTMTSNLMGSAGPRTYVRIVPICATFENGKSNMQATAAFQETAAFAAVLGAAIALIAAYSLWTLSGRK
jgi:hypothetical protein